MSKANPERKFQAAVEREAKITSLLTSTKLQSNFLATAKWECSLGIKDLTSSRKIKDDKVRADAKMTNKCVKARRREKLEELYGNDDIMYEEELRQMGLAFRRERT
jgi:hypothetical protein